ncbi:uncharacterized protein PRCAT00001701001 [Priceomyces carsonii]|uniref:uncharacterized protein n=1 Tax=Priceomyces carsonii TaxID=28549 RepID=UPI002EDAD6EA|nr:unnamed protein product [Priceomyces carsonii]
MTLPDARNNEKSDFDPEQEESCLQASHVTLPVAEGESETSHCESSRLSLINEDHRNDSRNATVEGNSRDDNKIDLAVPNNLQNETDKMLDSQSNKLSNEVFEDKGKTLLDYKHEDEDIAKFSDDEIIIDNQNISSLDESSSNSESESESEGESTTDDREPLSKEASEIRGIKAIHSNRDEFDDDEEDENSAGPILSKNEIIDEKAPLLPKDYTIPPSAPLELVGEITGIFERNIVIKANISGEFRILKDNSVLCLEDRTLLGPLFETFGRLQAPFYRVKFNSDEEFESFTSKKGAKVYYVVPSSQFLYTDSIKNIKGTDASNCHDEELPEEEQEFSDDERELAAKQVRKKKKKEKNNSKVPPKIHQNINDQGKRQTTDSISQAKRFQPYGYAQLHPQAPEYHTAYETNNFMNNGYTSYQPLHLQSKFFPAFENNGATYGLSFPLNQNLIMNNFLAPNIQGQYQLNPSNFSPSQFNHPNPSSFSPSQFNHPTTSNASLSHHTPSQSHVEQEQLLQLQQLIVSRLKSQKDQSSDTGGQGDGNNP